MIADIKLEKVGDGINILIMNSVDAMELSKELRYLAEKAEDHGVMLSCVFKAEKFQDGDTNSNTIGRIIVRKYIPCTER
jgi:hypothetical protein